MFKTKLGINGQPPRQKARLVVQGYEQKYDMYFEKVFALVVKWSTICSLATMAANRGHQIHHLGMKTMFLYGNLKEEVFMEQPVGFAQLGQEHLVCKLQISPYSLR